MTDFISHNRDLDDDDEFDRILSRIDWQMSSFPCLRRPYFLHNQDSNKSYTEGLTKKTHTHTHTHIYIYIIYRQRNVQEKCFENIKHLQKLYNIKQRIFVLTEHSPAIGLPDHN